MHHETPADRPSAPRAEPRIPFVAEVEVRFEDFEDFVATYSKNLSVTGMFIETPKPYDPGSAVHFQFEVAGSWRMIRGVGEVVWVRERSPEGGPGGMGVRFISIDAESRRMIRWLVDQNLARKQPAFELDDPKPATKPPPTEH